EIEEENNSIQLSTRISEKLPSQCDCLPKLSDKTDETRVLNEDDKEIYLKFKHDILKKAPFGENILKVLDDINDLYFSILSQKHYPCECKYRNTVQDSNEDAQIYTRVSEFVRLQKYQHAHSSSHSSSTLKNYSDIQIDINEEESDSLKIVDDQIKKSWNCFKDLKIFIKFPGKSIKKKGFYVTFEIFNMDLERIKCIRVETYVICSLGVALKHEAFYPGKNSIFGCAVECRDSLKNLVVFAIKEAYISFENPQDKELPIFSFVELGINNKSLHKGHKYVATYVSPNEINTEEMPEN
ncbi:hypothetical protein MXB_885, partial [Myxobolus squamalis]